MGKFGAGNVSMNVTASASTQATRATAAGSPLPAAGARAGERRKLRELEAKELIAKTRTQNKAAAHLGGTGQAN